jgi:hypothetical protein
MTPQQIENWTRSRRAGSAPFARRLSFHSTLGFACINLAIRLNQAGPVKWAGWLGMIVLFAVAMYAVGLALWRRQEDEYRQQTNTGA